LFNQKNDDKIHILNFDLEEKKIIYKMELNLGEYKYNNISLCGIINQIILDKDRLFISFRNNKLIAIFRCNFNSLYFEKSFLPLGKFYYLSKAL
jgi:hypothetical protein